MGASCQKSARYAGQYMKSFTFIFFLVAAILLLPHCTKSIARGRFDRPNPRPDTRELFGCRINGVAYNPQRLDPVLLGSCFYRSTYGGDFGWIFKMDGERHNVGCRSFSIGFVLDSVMLEEGKTYLLGNQGPRNNYGRYYLNSTCDQSTLELYTNDNEPGQVTITYFDPVDKSVSGTFSFTVSDNNGNVYEISHGVFDRHYEN